MKISDKYIFYCKNDLEKIKVVLKNKKLSGTSQFIEDYERKLAIFFGSKYAVAVSSGTSAIQAALFTLGIEKGDEVIVPPTCPSMTVFPILAVGAKPIFCDVSKNNFSLDVDDMEKIISPKTKAAIDVPMWGYPTDVIKTKEFLGNKKIPLILDLAQAHGTKLKDKFLSHYGEIACFSTHDRKILATGEGGFILTNNISHYNKIQSYIKFGNMNGIDFGLNFKLSSLQAGIGENRINLINKQLRIRENNAKYIVENIKNYSIREFEIIKKGKPNYYYLLLKLNFKDNQFFINYLEKNGIPSDIMRYNYKALYNYPLFNKYKRVCKNSELLIKSITTIPVHPGLNKKHLNYIISVINNYKN